MSKTPDFLLFRLVPQHLSCFTYECGPFFHEDGSPRPPNSTKSPPYVRGGESGVRFLRALPQDVKLDPNGNFRLVALAPNTDLPRGFVMVPMTEHCYLLTWSGPGMLELVEDDHGCRAEALDDLSWGGCGAKCAVDKNKFIWK